MSVTSRVAALRAESFLGRRWVQVECNAQSVCSMLMKVAEFFETRLGGKQTLVPFDLAKLTE